MASQEWWRGAVIYQIYPRSFQDSNADGIGDLPGITQNLDYIAALGVDAIWISPFFTSPMKDFGYDVSDYRDVDPMFGTLDDFDALLARAHEFGLKVIIDLVLSHTSDQHPWFHDEAKKDWYVWADGRNGGPPNNWVSVFGGPAWSFDETRGQYYLHNFLKEQPDLNFHNPDVQDAMLDIARFWLERGVDGFRLDVVNFYFHDRALRDNPPRPKELGAATQYEGDDPYSQQRHIYDKSQPENLEFLKRLRVLMNEFPGSFTVGESGDDDPYALFAQYTSGNERLHSMYNPHLAGGAHKTLTASLIRGPLQALEKYPEAGWPTWAFSNHDAVRAASRWLPSGDGFGQDQRFSRMLIVLLTCLRGTVFLYQGEELGLPEAKLNFDDLQDPWGKHLWPAWQGRDGCRTPMPWDEDTGTGQSHWLPVPETHRALNAAAQEQDPASVLSFARGFLQWRRHQDELRFGSIDFLETGDEAILAFMREYEGSKILCVFNLGGVEKEFSCLGNTIHLGAFEFIAEPV